jgi:hypothetical protein
MSWVENTVSPAITKLPSAVSRTRETFSPGGASGVGHFGNINLHRREIDVIEAIGSAVGPEGQRPLHPRRPVLDVEALAEMRTVWLARLTHDGR